jgi:hypothetical protein
MSLLPLALVLGLAAAGAVAVVRAVAMELRPMWLLSKPLSCDLCMSWWASIAVAVFALAAGLLEATASPLAVLASTAVSLACVRGSNRLSE